MNDPSDEASIGILVLAAGGALRMGGPKQLLPYRGRSLLRHAAEVAFESPCRPVCVVLGGYADRLMAETRDLSVLLVKNANWEAGMGSSIRAGLEAMLGVAADIRGVVITLCDQPHVTTDTVVRLLEAHRTSHQPVVASRYEGVVGVPALFSRDLFPQLLSSSESGGAKRLILENLPQVEILDTPEAVLDVDTPEDYASLMAQEGQTAIPPIFRAHDPDGLTELFTGRDAGDRGVHE